MYNMNTCNGLSMSMATLSRISHAKSRSISPENFTGAPGKGGSASTGTGATAAENLGIGWKISPSVNIAPQQTFELAHILTGGAIQQIWITTTSNVALHDLILRMYWDDQDVPSVEAPLGHFFCCGLEQYAHVSSLAVCVNPGRALNCFWEMPYRKNARITLENRDKYETVIAYYQINYIETEVPENCAYFHAQFRKSGPVAYKKGHVILDGIAGMGHYVGTYMTWSVNNGGWWGEGEMKFYIDEDVDFPTICGTGTEDYFLGSYNFDVGAVFDDMPSKYVSYTTPYAGLPEIQVPDGVYKSQQRFGMYRWHITDPIRFQKKLQVSVQCLGWKNHEKWKSEDKRRYMPRRDTIESMAFWYQMLPSPTFPTLPTTDEMLINT